MPLIRDWELRTTNGNYCEIDPSNLRFKGVLVGANGKYDGEGPKIVGFDVQENAFVSEDRNFFRLREPHPGYGAVFPNWRKSLDKMILGRKIKFLSWCDSLKW